MLVSRSQSTTCSTKNLHHRQDENAHLSRLLSFITFNCELFDRSSFFVETLNEIVNTEAFEIAGRCMSRA